MSGMRRSPLAEASQRTGGRAGLSGGPEPPDQQWLPAGEHAVFADMLPASLTDGSGDQITVSPAKGAATTAALELLYGRWPVRDRVELVRDAVQSAAAGSLDLKHLLVARAGNSQRILGAALALERPGREAVVWVPGVDSRHAPATLAVRLLEVIAKRLDSAGVSCGVCFVDPLQAADRDVLERGGFPGIADLCLLRSDLKWATPWTGMATGDHEWCGWTESLRSEFAESIERIQRDALDCPEIGLKRTGADILASHSAEQSPAPELWRLYRRSNTRQPAVGVMLLADHASRGDLEILYLGVDPSARRRGIARRMMYDAVQLARERRRHGLTVAVESRNAPALALYSNAGLVETRRYGIHLRVAPDASKSAS